MKRWQALLVGGALLAAAILPLAGCDRQPVGGEGDDPPPSSGKDAMADKSSLEYAFEELYPDGELKDEANGFSAASALSSARIFVNGEYKSSFKEMSSRRDVKLEFRTESAVRLANLSAGYVFTLPAAEYEADYSIAKYRTQYTFGENILTASLEAGNPYTADADAWYKYCSEWVFKYFGDGFLEANGISRLREAGFRFTQESPHGNLEIKPGYDVYRYDLLLENTEGEIERDHYHIAAIREAEEVKEVAIFVLKGKEDASSILDTVIQSYRRIPSKGIPRNYFSAEKPLPNPRWNEETAAYFESLLTREEVLWGAFSMSMPGYRDEYLPTDPNYTYVLDLSTRYEKGIEEAWGWKYDIYPTYTALSYAGEKVRFPIYMAEELAGGNGTNGKPVLQFTYQFTGNNNLMGSTPMFDIMRGKYDGQFRELAEDIKNYRHPVLFRLNNEMNTDWTSYCGLITLLDPDIFTITWRRLYDIFEEVGVDNAIWIWNPVATSCPYSGWGEDLCYFPGREYVQILGGTYYELNNYAASAAPTSCKSFRELYAGLYEKNQPAFGDWIVILSEFGCGSGGDYSGELGRNRDVQLKWVRDMFEELNAEEPADYVKQIKGAIWFNANDYADGSTVTNRYQIYDPRNNTYADLLPLLEAFREGLAN